MRRAPFVTCLFAAALIAASHAQVQTLNSQSKAEAAPDHSLRVVSAEIRSGQLQVVGIQAARSADIAWEGGIVTRANPGGAFRFSTTELPSTCVGTLSDGASTIAVPISGCRPQATLSPFAFPATGQTTCWNSAGTVIACTDTGQDGEKRAGAPLSFTSNSDGTITDNNTGLVWEKKLDCSGGLHCVDVTYTWQEALDYVKALNAANFAGHSDWRLPNVKELQSILHYDNANAPAVSPEFNDCSHGSCIGRIFYYWSSSSHVHNPAWAWFVYFGDGVVGAQAKTYKNDVRAVRGGL